VLPSVLLIAMACQEFGFNGLGTGDPPDRRVVVEERFVQAPLEGVDVLFVIDETPSMEQEFDALADSVGALMAGLDSSGLNWQLGVVGADMIGEDRGLLWGVPWVITADTPEREELFAEMLVTPPVPTQSEAGLAAAILALELATDGGANEGFRRPDAGLQVVFVSDGDDSSATLHDDPVAAFLERIALEEASGSWARASALVGDVPSGCASPRGTAQPGTAYVEVAEATGGVVASICHADFAAVLEALSADSVVLPVRFELAEVPVSDEVQVSVDGVQATGWELAVDPPAVVFDTPPDAGVSILVSYTVATQ